MVETTDFPSSEPDGQTNLADAEELNSRTDSHFKEYLAQLYSEFAIPGRAEKLLVRSQNLINRFYVLWFMYGAQKSMDQELVNGAALLGRALDAVVKTLTEDNLYLSTLYDELDQAAREASTVAGQLDTSITGYRYAGFREGSLSEEMDKIHQELNDVGQSFYKLRVDITSAKLFSSEDQALYDSKQTAAVLERANATESALNQVAKDARQAAGLTGAAGLASGFDNFATADEKRTLSLRIIAGLSTLLGIGVIFWVFTTRDLTDPISSYLIRLSVVVPLLGFSGYLLREATHTRRDAADARRYAVRLKLIRAYTEDLADEDKSRIRARFGEAIFLELNPHRENTKPNSIEDPSKALGAIESIIKSVRKSE